ncbi:hypothetical protein HanXRQr2_Chr12g0541731 [Helianthus annuus]|uniref:Uncharacterized protein n=1 Tax=Helianthus annuus TaxID=4232 RepID=A0A9K3HGK6_HELAN|nr:hypothetical protein HanXRQr2_Chr12g0541731 [Helianthus annuus]KAJ0862717.1 hypothetical protein HanPSC8_Chr12g0521541 [Helianthus annuus]
MWNSDCVKQQRRPTFQSYTQGIPKKEKFKKIVFIQICSHITLVRRTKPLELNVQTKFGS